jgi:hypothetical protein
VPYAELAAWMLRKLDIHLVRIAALLAAVKTGNKIAARIAIIAITTRSSIKVKPFLFPLNTPNPPLCAAQLA